MVIAVRPETLDEYKRPRTARISQGAPSVATSASFTLRNAAFQLGPLPVPLLRSQLVYAPF